MKNFLYAIVCVLPFAILSACVGGSNSSSLSTAVTSGSCTRMTKGSTCAITVTYNTNNQSGVTLAISQNANAGSSLSNFSLSGCPSSLTASNTSATCTETVTCGDSTTGCSGAGNIGFSLSGGSSNATSSVPISAL